MASCVRLESGRHVARDRIQPRSRRAGAVPLPRRDSMYLHVVDLDGQPLAGKPMNVLDSRWRC